MTTEIEALIDRSEAATLDRHVANVCSLAASIVDVLRADPLTPAVYELDRALGRECDKLFELYITHARGVHARSICPAFDGMVTRFCDAQSRAWSLRVALQDAAYAIEMAAEQGGRKKVDCDEPEALAAHVSRVVEIAALWARYLGAQRFDLIELLSAEMAEHITAIVELYDASEAQGVAYANASALRKALTGATYALEPVA